MTASPSPAGRDCPEEDPPKDPSASLRMYLRGWLRIGLLVSPTLILAVGVYLLLR